MIQPPSIGRRVLSAGLGVTLSLLELPVTPFLAWGHPKPARALLRLEAVTDSPDPFSPNGDGRLEETLLSATAAFRPKDPAGVEASGRHAEKTLAHDRKKTLKALQKLAKHIPKKQFLLRLSWTLQDPATPQPLVTLVQDRLIQPPFALQVLPTGTGRVGHFLVTSVSQRWDGREPQGQLLPDGRYPYTVQAALIVQKRAGDEGPRHRARNDDDEDDVEELLAGALGVGEHTLLLSEVATGTLTLDTTPPVVTITSPATGSFFNTSPITVSGTVDDPAALVEVNGIPATVGTGTFTAWGVPLTEGLNTLTATATDLAQNVGTASVQVTLDTVPPAISALAPPDGALLDTARPTLSASFTDATSGIDRASVRLVLDGLDVTAQAAITDATISFTPSADLADGPHTIQFQVVDQAGNLATAQTTFTVQTVQEPPITPESGFIHGQVFHAVTEQPLADATITIGGIVGALRSGADGRYQFPTPGSGEFAITIEKAGFTSVQRQAAVFATRDVAVEPAFLTPLDPIVTLITAAEGGVATDSSGTFEVTFPPGAAPRDLPVTITPLADERQLPGPMEDGQGHLAAVYFEPRFTTFNTPATLRVRNTLGVPPGTPVNLQLWHEDGQEWQDVDPGRVTVDGQWIEFRIIRFFCWYCLWLKRILPVRTENPQQPTPTTSEAQDPGKGCEVRDQSAVCLASGRLSESHSLPSLHTLGTSQALTFIYHSSTASPSVLLGTDYTLSTGDPASPLIPATTSATIQIEGRLMTASFQGASGPLRQAVLWDGQNARGELVPTGAYPYTVALSNDYAATLEGTGLPAIGRSMLTTQVASRAILINERASPFGAGWSLEGLQRLYPQPDGTLLVTDGDGSAAVFRRGPQADLATVSSSIDDVLVLSGHGDGTFQPLQRFVLGLTDPPSPSTSPSWMAAGDFNEDGRQDLAVTLSRTGEVALLFGQGRAVFAAAQRIAVESTLVLVSVADFNRDGHDDLAVVSQSANTVAILLGQGDGTFQPKRVTATGHGPSTMAVGDLTGDGILDMVVGNAGSVNEGPQTAAILVGVGDGTFQPAASPVVGRTPTAAVLGDVNADTFLDLVVANRIDFALSLLLGRGDGTFQPAQPIPLGGRPSALAVSDINGDSRPDLVVVDDRNTVTVLLATGPATFQPLPSLPTGQGPSALAIGDVNQDGVHDLAVTNQGAGSISFLSGNGDGTFARHREFPVGFQPVGLVLGEFDDRRGDPDQVFSGLPGEFSQLRKHPDGTYTRQLTDGTQFRFDARGLHTQTLDRNGNETRYVYDAQDRLIRVEMPGQAAFDLVYNAAGQLAALTDSSGRATQVVLDGRGDVRRLTNPDGTTREFTYDGEHRMTSQTNERGVTTDYVYDAFGRVAEAVLPERPVFDAVTGAVSSQREIRRFTPAETQGLINTLPAGVGTPENPAPPVQPPLSIFEDGRGNTTRVATDAFGAPTKLVDPLGRTTIIQRDVNGLPVRVTQPDGAQTTMLYDSRGNLIFHIHRLIDPRSSASFFPLVTRFAYDPRFSQVTKIIDARRDSLLDPLQHDCPSGCTTRIEHDAQGNPLRIIDHLGQVTAFTYDSRGLVTTITDALGTATPAIPDDHQVRFAYDALTGNLLTTTDQLSRATSLGYDAAGNVVTSTDAASRTTTFTYDGLNRLTAVADPAGGLTRYAYDEASNLTRVTDAKLQATQFTYDSLNQLTSTMNPVSQTQQFFYDLSRNLAQVLDAKGQTIHFLYDAANQLKTKRLTDATGLPQDTVTYAYDSLGNLTLVQDADSKLTYEYDSAGRLITATTGEPGDPAVVQPATTIEYSSTPTGNRQGMSCPQCGGVGYVYDGLNRLVNMLSRDGFGATFAYDLLSRVTQISPSGARILLAYDDASQLTTIQGQALPRGLFEDVTWAEYRYDRLGNRTSLTDRVGLHTYTYDALNRLTGATHPAPSGLVPEAFTYDAVGNRLSSHLSSTHRHDPANRLLEDATFLYTYNANGNRTGKTDKTTGATTTYTYDVENQLTRIDLPDGTFAAYRYDALGRRIEKDVAGVLTRYLYDQEDLVAVFRGPTNCQTHAVFHGPGIDQPLLFFRDTNADCNPFRDGTGFGEPLNRLLPDGLGSPTVLVSEVGGGFSRGQVVAERYTYDSFGTPTILGPGPDGWMDTPDDTPIACSAFGNPFLFTGREYDCESGLIYMRARYYDPHTGTFLQEDPLGFFVSANAYPYVTNNPVNLTDPLGLLPRKLGPFPNPAWSETRDRVKQEFSTRFGDRFSDEELNFAAEKFADEVRLKELNRLRDPHTQGETLKDIGQRIKDEVERTGSPQEKDIVKRLEEAIMEEAKRQQERAQCQLDRSPPTELLW